MDLLALADFNLVARHGGFGRAARAAGRPKATLSRRVTELENSLGLRLFERGARAPKLTQEGKALHERTSRLLTEVEETTAAIASGDREPRGNLRICAPLLFSLNLRWVSWRQASRSNIPTLSLKSRPKTAQSTWSKKGTTWPFASIRVPMKAWWDGSSCGIGL